jgi:hypothetical protein
VQLANGTKVEAPNNTWEDVGWCEGSSQANAWHLKPGTEKIYVKTITYKTLATAM